MSDIQDNIFRDGTSQKMRYNSGLDPGKVLVDGRDMEYLLRYLAKLAGKISYYDLANFPSDKWQSFFPEDAEIPAFISNLPSSNNLSPQLGLFMAFIQMMDMLKADINQLSTKHLEFYFEKVLRFVRQKAKAEK